LFAPPIKRSICPHDCCVSLVLQHARFGIWLAIMFQWDHKTPFSKLVSLLRATQTESEYLHNIAVYEYGHVQAQILSYKSHFKNTQSLTKKKSRMLRTALLCFTVTLHILQVFSK
jgi:hypothetical protein